ncbi:MAG: hypothetical protein E6G44_06875 [Actinobacteria bacterium]|nr:MAG: hypothetical protein E6G44_06875 [Actinomycetota bacterium]
MAVGCAVGQIVKSLVFDPKRMAELLAASTVRRADAEEARGATGFGIGGTPPFGYPRPLTVLVDRDLMEHELLWAAAGTPDAVFPITPDQLVGASGGSVAEIKADP